MDYSTISNKTTCTEIEDVTNGDLKEQYYLLKKQYENLSSNYDNLKQELHDTNRNYQTALDIQQHLTIELESHQVDQERRKNDFNSKISTLQEEITVLREERNEISDRHSAELTRLQAEIKKLKEEVCVKEDKTSYQDSKELEDLRVMAATAITEAKEHKVSLDKAKMEIASWQMQVEMLNTHIEETKQAAEVRKEELLAANEREAVALADLAEVRAMLHQFTAPQDSLQPHAAKGNSLFAEVEDKRQEMAKNLIQMKQTNSKLKRDLANKQAEVDTLLHEKQTIWEQQLGASAHYDRELIENYEERISQLEALTERQRRELARWFSKLSEPAANGWLPGVLDHLKSECEKLRAEVLSRGAAQLASAAQVRELRRKLALASSTSKVPTKQPSFDDKENIKVDDNARKSVVKKDVKINSDVVRTNVDDVRKKVSFN